MSEAEQSVQPKPHDLDWKDICMRMIQAHKQITGQNIDLFAGYWAEHGGEIRYVWSEYDRWLATPGNEKRGRRP